MGFKKIPNGIRERVYKLCKIVNPIRVKVNDEYLPCLWGNNNDNYVIIYPRHSMWVKGQRKHLHKKQLLHILRQFPCLWHCKQEHLKFEAFYQKNKPKIE